MGEARNQFDGAECSLHSACAQRILARYMDGFPTTKELGRKMVYEVYLEVTEVINSFDTHRDPLILE